MPFYIKLKYSDSGNIFKTNCILDMHIELDLFEIAIIEGCSFGATIYRKFNHIHRFIQTKTISKPCKIKPFQKNSKSNKKI
jgi:hypothetical protein